MPEQDCAVLGSGRNVAIRCDVAFGTRDTRHHAVVPEDYLDDFGYNKKVHYMTSSKNL